MATTPRSRPRAISPGRRRWNFSCLRRMASGTWPTEVKTSTSERVCSIRPVPGRSSQLTSSGTAATHASARPIDPSTATANAVSIRRSELSR